MAAIHKKPEVPYPTASHTAIDEKTLTKKDKFTTDFLEERLQY